MRLLLLAFLFICAPAFAVTTDFYVCDCGTGSSSSPACVAGSDAADGLTAATAQRTTTAFLAAWTASTGTRTLYACKGGAWNNFRITTFPIVTSLTVTGYTSPSFTSTAKPRFNTNTTSCSGGLGNPCSAFFFSTGLGGATVGNYTLDGITVDGSSVATTQAFYMFRNVNNIKVINSTFQNLGEIGGCQTSTGYFPKYMNVSNNTASNIQRMGIVSYGCSHVLAEGNVLDDISNASLPIGTKLFDHPFYFSGEEANVGSPARDVIVRGNIVTNWGKGANDLGGSAATQCGTAAIVGHAEIQDWVIENNVFKMASGASFGQCWGINISPNNGDGLPEYQKKMVIRNNQTYNTYIGIATSGCQGCVIENNRHVFESNPVTYDMRGIQVQIETSSTPHTINSAITIQNNSVYMYGCTGSSECTGIYFLPADTATNHVMANNSVTFGAGGSTGRYCFQVDSSASHYAYWNKNHCNNFNNWSNTHSTMAAFASARSQDTSSCNAAANFAATPSVANSADFRVNSPSCLINGGDTTYKSRSTALGHARPSASPDIGANEFGVD